MRPIKADQTVNDIISTIAKLDGVDVDELLLNGSFLAGDECFADYYDSPSQLFMFSKSSKRSPSTDSRSNPPVKVRPPARDCQQTPSTTCDRTQYATIGDDHSNPIGFESYLFLGCSLRYFEQRRANPLDRDLRFDATFERDSVVQFLNICQEGRPFTLTRQNIFEVELLCKEWEITNKRVLGEVERFIRNPPGAGRLVVGRLQFSLGRGLATEDLEAEVRDCLVEFVEDDELLKVPVGVMVRIVDFRVYLGDSEGYDRVLNFCIKYYGVHGAKSSQIFRTLEIGRLGTEQLERLYALEDVHWCWQDRSVVGSMIKALGQLEQRVRELGQQRERELAQQRKREAELKSLLQNIILHPKRAYTRETARRAFPDIQFPPSRMRGQIFDPPNGILRHLTTACGGNVHDHNVVEVTSGSFEHNTSAFSLHLAKNVTEMDTLADFSSAYRRRDEDIQHTRNNWVCYDFKERRIVPTHYTIRTNRTSGRPVDTSPALDCERFDARAQHQKSWLVETSADGTSWREIDRQENNARLEGTGFTAIFAVAGGGECRFIRLVNVGRNQAGSDKIWIEAWEIFGNLIE